MRSGKPVLWVTYVDDCAQDASYGMNHGTDTIPNGGERALDLWCMLVEVLHSTSEKSTYARDNGAHLRNSSLPLFVVSLIVVTLVASL